MEDYRNLLLVLKEELNTYPLMGLMETIIKDSHGCMTVLGTRVMWKSRRGPSMGGKSEQVQDFG